jgi:hypothetical protein
MHDGSRLFCVSGPDVERIFVMEWVMLIVYTK